MCVHSKQPESVHAAHFSRDLQEGRGGRQMPTDNSRKLIGLGLTAFPTFVWLLTAQQHQSAQQTDRLMNLTCFERPQTLKWANVQEPQQRHQAREQTQCEYIPVFFIVFWTNYNTRRCKQMEQSDSVSDHYKFQREKHKVWHVTAEMLALNILLYIVSNTKIGKEKYFSLHFAAEHWLMAAAGHGSLCCSVEAEHWQTLTSSELNFSFKWPLIWTELVWSTKTSSICILSCKL